jgi:hypothetical protein
MQHHGLDPAKRSVLLMTIARIPGIDVETGHIAVTVRYRYVVNNIASEARYDFDRATGNLVGRSVAALATATAPEVLLSESSFESRLEFNDKVDR